MKIIHRHFGKVKTSTASQVSACHVDKYFNFVMLGNDDIELVFVIRESQTMRINLHFDGDVWGIDPEVRLVQHYSEQGCPPIGEWTRPFDREDMAVAGQLSMAMSRLLVKDGDSGQLVKALRCRAGLREVA